jgi:hypothetical protein
MIGVIFLLGIAISLISVIFLQVLSTPGPQDTTRVTIIGKIEDTHPVFEIQRGEPLGLDTKIIRNIGGVHQIEYTVEPYIQQKFHYNQWNIGEPAILPTVPNNPRVEWTIVDIKTNSIVFQGVLQ